eukprot:SAG22_NODE_802_length_7099_cov_122.579429_6_plen_73_part_00
MFMFAPWLQSASKGSDASNKDDEEVAAHEQEYSDDEQEQVRCPGLHSWTPAHPVSCLLTGVPAWRPGERAGG